MIRLDAFSLEIDGFRMQRDAGKWFLRSQVRTRTVRARIGGRSKLPSRRAAFYLTRAVALLLVVLGSAVELVTCAVFVTQPLPLPTDVVIVKVAVEPAARDASSQRTMRVALA